MKRAMLFRAMTVLLVMAMLTVLPVLGGCKKKDKTTPDTPVSADKADEETTSTEGGSSDGQTPGETQTPPATPGTDGSASAPSAPAPPTTLTVRLAWVESGEAAFATERTIPYTQAPATAAMNALLAGPTQQELTTWPAISSAIPAGTKLLGLTVSGGVAKVDLSKEFESGGGTFSVTARLAQVVYTLTQFPSIQAVEFYLDGQKVEMFSSEGLILDGPQTIEDYEDLLPMDA